MTLRMKAWLIALATAIVLIPLGITMIAILNFCLGEMAAWTPDRGTVEWWLVRALTVVAWVGIVLPVLFCVLIAAAALFDIGERRWTREDAPLLWERVDQLCARMDMAPIDRITSTDDFTAGACSRRAWLFGRWRHTLLLGVPLLRLLSADEAETVILHELAHIRAGDTQGQRMIRISSSILQGVADGPWDAWPRPLRRLLSRFAIRYRQAVAARDRERESRADRAAAQAGSKEVFARALVRLNLECESQAMAARFDWASNGKPSRHGTLPPIALDISDDLTADERKARALRRQLARPSAWDARHPSLHERLSALDLQLSRVEIPAPVQRGHSAADIWIGDRVESHEPWKRGTTASPTCEPSTTISRVREELIALLDSLRARHAELSLSELWLWFMGSKTVGLHHDARLAIETLVRLDPHDPALSSCLLIEIGRRCDPADAALAERLVRNIARDDPAQHGAALQELATYQASIDRIDQAQATWAFAERQRSAMRHPTMRPEAWVGPTHLDAPSIAAERRTALAAVVTTSGEVEEAWLVRLHGAWSEQHHRHAIVVARSRRLLPRWRAWEVARERLAAVLADPAIEILELKELSDGVRARLAALPEARLMRRNRTM